MIFPNTNSEITGFISSAITQNLYKQAKEPPHPNYKDAQIRKSKTQIKINFSKEPFLLLSRQYCSP